eukprot:3003524-Rhodomonas_salina.2
MLCSGVSLSASLSSQYVLLRSGTHAHTHDLPQRMHHRTRRARANPDGQSQRITETLDEDSIRILEQDVGRKGRLEPVGGSGGMLGWMGGAAGGSFLSWDAIANPRCTCGEARHATPGQVRECQRPVHGTG